MFSGNNELILIFLFGTLFILMLFIFIMIFIVVYQQRTQKLNKELQQKELEKQKQIFFALQEGEEKERKRLAEELHDGIGAQLSGLKMGLEFLYEKAEAPQVDLIHKTLKGLDQAIVELREISQNLQPALFLSKGLSNAIDDFTEQLNQKEKCHYTVYIDPALPQLNESLNIALYRIICELLHNIHKHAEAREASVQLLIADDLLGLTIEDNGKGFDQQHKKSGIGLLNIKNRVLSLEGNLNIDSNNKGTVISIQLPLKAGSA